jgi:hypothetical protein
MFLLAGGFHRNTYRLQKHSRCKQDRAESPPGLPNSILKHDDAFEQQESLFVVLPPF